MNAVRAEVARRPGALAWCVRAARVTRKDVARVVGSGALSTACAIGLLATSGWLITRASTRPPSYVLALAIGAVQAFALGRGVFRYLQRLSVHGLSLRGLAGLRLRLYDSLEPLVPGGLPEGGTGAVLSSFLADTDLVAQGLAQGATVAVDVVASVVLGTAVAAVVSPPLGLVLLVGTIVLIACCFGAARLGRDAARAEAALRAELAASVVETMRSARELVAYGREDLLAEQLGQVRHRSVGAALRRSASTGLGRAAAALVSGAVLLAILGTDLGLRAPSRVPGVMLAVVVFAALAVLDQVSALAGALGDTGGARAAAERLGQLASLPRPTTEPDGALSPGSGPLSAALEKAWVCAPDGTALLENVSLEVGSRHRLGVVGRNGSGKSTVIHTLLHFLECRAGRASLGGADVAHMRRETLARHVGWMSEDTHVFVASLAENLRLASGEATDDQCREVLRRVGLDRWLESLPDGLSTQLGSGGLQMSAGERQRLGLARALLAGGSVLLLDEPTAHIDPLSSAEVLSELLTACEGRAVLVVSHDPDLVGLVDTLVRLDSGRVVEPTADDFRGDLVPDASG